MDNPLKNDKSHCSKKGHMIPNLTMEKIVEASIQVKPLEDNGQE